MQNRLIIVYLLVFLSAIILLRMIGVIQISNLELLGYALIIYGLSLFYSSYIRNNKLFLFIGSVLFLFGVLLFLIENFEFTEPGKLILPASVFIICISTFMVYISDIKQKLMLYISIILLTAGIGVTALLSKQGLPGFFGNIVSVAEKYWTILVILIIVIVLVGREIKENERKDNSVTKNPDDE